MTRFTLLARPGVAAPLLALLALLTLAPSAARAQEAAHRQPAMVPTAVALSLNLGAGPFGPPRFYVDELPAGWPSALVPPGASVVGGGEIGDTTMFRMQVGIFDLGAAPDPASVLRALATREGFAERPRDAAPSGGFVATDGAGQPASYCRGSTMAVITPIDSLQSPGVIAVHLIDGEPGRQACGERPVRTVTLETRIRIPAMSPPPGAVLHPGGSSTSGESGDVSATMVTTMPADSVMAHFTAQLAAGGWRADGAAAVADGAGVQRFRVRQDDEDWVAALFIVMLRGRYELRLEYAREM